MTINRQVSYFDGMGKPTIPAMQLFGGVGRVLPPSLTTAQRNVYAAQPGEVIYNTTTGKLNYWNAVASAWEAITST